MIGKIRYGQALAIVALFLVIGPPVGALAFSLLGGAGAWIMDANPGTAGMIFYAGILSIVISWFVGGIQAALSGAAVALFAAVTGRLSVLVAIAAGLLCGLVIVFGEDLGPGMTALFLAVHVVASGVCALIVKATFTGPAHP